MKSGIALIVFFIFFFKSLSGQNSAATRNIDLLLLRGEYNRAIDTCRQLLVYDNLDPEIHYRLGLAYMNTLDEDRSLESFYQAYSLNPGDEMYSFLLAKAYYGKEKYKLAEPLFQKLCFSDSLDWTYASYLTSIYMHYNRYDEAIAIYRKFQANDSTNYTYFDKIGFASLKKGDYQYATELYTKSLSLNDSNLIAIKNLAYIFSATRQSDTAIAILTRGIKIDPSDMSLYSMRGQLYYAKNYNKRALDDYLKILASGDTSELYLKRAGIGYCNNMQSNLAVNFLLKAYKIDSSDYETCSYLGQSYYNLRDMGRSEYYYKKVIGILTPVNRQLGLSYTLLAESQKGNGLYNDAIKSYLRAVEISGDPNLYMIVANIYDEQFEDRKNAVKYYQLFLDGIKKSGGAFSGKYLDSIKDRMEYLKTEPAKQ
jgi:tetratricopeptide (TPR) repeat protein